MRCLWCKKIGYLKNRTFNVWANLEVLLQWQSTAMPAEEADDFDLPLFYQVNLSETLETPFISVNTYASQLALHVTRRKIRPLFSGLICFMLVSHRE